MIRIAITSLVLFAGVLGGTAQSSLKETRNTVEQWVETRQLVSETKADWVSDKDTLLQTERLFRQELENVQQALARISTNFGQVRKEQESAEAERLALEAALERAAQIASSLEIEARKLIPLLPDPLLQIVQPLVNRLPEDPAKTKAPVVERIQAVVALLNEIDKFNNTITVANERRSDPGGGQVNVDTIYLGLGTAYFVEPSEKFAGVGTPAAQGWKWTVTPDIAPAVREVIAMYRNQKPAAFTQLPATVQ
jgi:hypothetical protein